jgi:hypothetical protein
MHTPRIGDRVFVIEYEAIFAVANKLVSFRSNCINESLSVGNR